MCARTIPIGRQHEAGPIKPAEFQGDCFAWGVVCASVPSPHGPRIRPKPNIRDVLPRLKCRVCRLAPHGIYLVAGFHRNFGAGGPDPDWCIPIRCR
ncbi:hypothetical protein AciX9_4685 (plasmid) [Granulicella tundricola MP5ACTX9]|uniref:Uncharacterized protein n=1 Tax=Granulicella tundricola (strain ATCC BAA-1859 / DSM 23138 / MP5ACTX9) TaxID=1198114 RepID=E8X830_GRATM|nr:hypothetical protein AciX9_4685 [Granulicella tundricola MP5ACTX9]